MTPRSEDTARPHINAIPRLTGVTRPGRLLLPIAPGGTTTEHRDCRHEWPGNYTLPMATRLENDLRPSAVPRWSHRDPVESGNPFPPTDRRHGTWNAATTDATQELLRLDAGVEATAQITLDPAIYRAQLLDLAVARFDVWAERARAVVSDGATLRDYERWLDDYVRNWLRYVADTCPRVEVGEELRIRLNNRAAQWSRPR